MSPALNLKYGSAASSRNTMDRADAHPAGQIRPLTCPDCRRQGLHYYTDLALYDDERSPDQQSLLPRDAPAVPGHAIDANLDVIVCASCGFIDFRRLHFDTFPKQSFRVRNRPTAATPNATLGSP